jgi:hypothetical protein
MLELKLTVKLNVAKLLNGFTVGVLASILANIICKYIGL